MPNVKSSSDSSERGSGHGDIAARREQRAEVGEPLGGDEFGERLEEARARDIGRVRGRRCGGAEVALLRTGGACVARHEQQRRHLLAVAEGQVAHFAQEPVDHEQVVGRDRRTRDRDVDQPRVRPVRTAHGEHPRGDTVAPRALDGVVGHRGNERTLLHQQDEVVLAGHVAVQRHRREPERCRNPAHRHRSETLRIGDLDGGLDDALDRELALGPALGVRRDAPRQRDAAGEFGIGSHVAHSAPVRGWLDDSLELCIT